MANINRPINTMLTVREVSRLLHVHSNTLRRWSDQGIIKAYRIGPRGDRRFKPEDIAVLLMESGKGLTINANESKKTTDDTDNIEDILISR